MSNKSNFLGLDDVTYINNGNWADPQIKYKGYILNYYDLEEGLQQSYNADIESENKEISFDEYLKENIGVVYSELDDLINCYWEAKLQESPFKELDSLKDTVPLNVFNQSLMYQLKAIESDYESYYLDDYKLEELKVSSDDEMYEYLMKTSFDMFDDISLKKDISRIPGNIGLELLQYKQNEERIKNGEPVFTEEDLEVGINVKIEQNIDLGTDDINKIILYLSAWYDSQGEGIYYEIRNGEGQEIDGGIQLFGLENSSSLVLQKNLVKDLIEISAIETIYDLRNLEISIGDTFERLENGNIEDIVDFEDIEEEM